MKWTRTALCLLAALLAISCAAAAADDFLAVDQAFKPSAQRVDADHVAVTWQIADGYYLYRHAFTFKAQGGAALGKADIPAGDKHTDEFFGEVETYRNRLTVTVPMTAGAARLSKLDVTYQGCADAGICYPPQSRTLTVPAAAETAAPTGPAAATTPDNAPPAASGTTDRSEGAAQPANASADFVSEQDRIAGVLDKDSTLWVVLSFLGLGLLLAFTPCVLPMIPILSGIVVGRGEKTSAMRGFTLSCAYVFAMALAYTFFGVLAGLFGANLQALLQSPWTLVPFALVFVALALSMFGYYELQLPASWQTRLNSIGRGREGDVAGAAIIGFVSALVVGPCLAPPLAGALLYIGASGDALLGGLALFALGLGMGLPLIALGTLGGGVLPRAGEWMIRIKAFFGVVLLGVAIWLLARILPGPLVLALWAALLMAYGVHLGALEAAPRDGAGPSRLAKAAGLLAVVYAILLLLGAAGGSSRPLQPLQGFTLAGNGASAPATAQSAKSPFMRVAGPSKLAGALDAAARAGRPAVVDFYADWCVECVQMEHTVFADADVRAALSKVAALQVDVTDYDATDRALLKRMGVFGPPSLLFYRADGQEAKNRRLVGRVDAAGLLRHLRRIGAPVGTPIDNDTDRS